MKIELVALVLSICLLRFLSPTAAAAHAQITTCVTGQTAMSTSSLNSERGVDEHDGAPHASAYVQLLQDGESYALYLTDETGCASFDAAAISTAEPTVPDSLVCPGSGREEPNVFVIVEEMPDLIGGLPSVQRRIVYPDSARQEGIEGRVIIQFIVDTEGRVFQPQIVRGLSPEINEEAIRAVLPARFEPGRQRGEKVCVKMSLPVIFRLD